MTETHDPAERPGNAAPVNERRVLTAPERDELIALVRAYGRAEIEDERTHARGSSADGDERRAAAKAAQAAYGAFLDRVYELTARPTLDELLADQARRQADGPRADALVEVVAECKGEDQ